MPQFAYTVTLLMSLACLPGCHFEAENSSTKSNTNDRTLLTAEEPVRLLESSLQQTVCSSCISLTGTIELKNIAYEKEVDVFYGCAMNESDPNSEWRWRSEPALYQDNDAANDRELWKFQINSPGCYSKARVAVRYKVAGETYWDNNCGWNYNILRHDGQPVGKLLGRQHSCL